MIYNPDERLGIPILSVPVIGMPKLPFINVFGAILAMKNVIEAVESLCMLWEDGSVMLWEDNSRMNFE